MPHLRFLNIRFNLDVPAEFAIFNALSVHPAGVRSRVVREALAMRLGVELEPEENTADRAPVRVAKSVQSQVKRGSRTQKASDAQPVKEPQLQSELKQEETQETFEPSPGTDNDQAGESTKEERQAVKGLLSMLH